jgi:hypothetical protein
MADYFLVHEGDLLERQVRPALAASWAQRSFEPCRELCAALLPAARDFARRYHAGGEEPFVGRVAAGLPFDRDLWRLLAGDLLFTAAAEIPELPLCPDTLYALLGADASRNSPREQMAPIVQAHRGSRDLCLGAVRYRPEHAGYNDAADVARLAAYLASLQPEAWTAEMLRGTLPIAPQDGAEELAFAREALAALRGLYEQAHARGRVIVVESID